MSAIDLVKKFWSLMESNDFRSVGEVLSDDFELKWPQSNETLRGRDNFAAMNEEYPSHGLWRFTVNRIVANENEAVTDVSVTDGVQNARVISFFSVSNDVIRQMVEFWPEDFPPAQNRRHLVEKN
jgi:ketosteroid isomerase-like protein